jgi:hypothetical protein
MRNQGGKLSYLATNINQTPLKIDCTVHLTAYSVIKELQSLTGKGFNDGELLTLINAKEV